MQAKQTIQPPKSAQNFKNDSSIQQPPINQSFQRARNEEPIRINADDESQCIICIYALSIILPLIVIIIIAIFAAPDATLSVNQTNSLATTNLAGCKSLLYRSPNDSQYLSCFEGSNITNDANSSVGMYIRGLTKLNQFLLFYLDLSNWANSMNSKELIFDQFIQFNIYVAQYSPLNNKTHVIDTINSQNSSVPYSVGKLRRKKVFLGFQSKVKDGQQFYVQLKFQSNTTLTSQSSFNLNIKTINESFTLYTIILRVAFFLLSVLVYVKYVTTIMKIPKNVVSIEQKGVQLIGVLTVLFNDQLFFITVLWPNPFTSFLSACFIWNILFGYFNLWISFLIRILYGQPDTTTLQTKKPSRIVLLILFYLVGLGFSTALAIIQTNEYPMVTPDTIDSQAFRFFFVSMIICFVFGIIYLVYLYGMVFCYKKNRPYRHNVFMYLTLCFILGVIIVTLMGSFQVFDYSGALVFFTFGFFNFYTYFLMYLYSPTKSQIQLFQQGAKRWVQQEKNQELGEAKSVNIELQEEIQNASEKLGAKSGGTSERRRKRLRELRKKEKRVNGDLEQGQSVQKIGHDDDLVEKQNNKSISLDSDQLQ